MLFVDQSGEPGGAELMLRDLARGWPGRCRVVTLAEGTFVEMLRADGTDVKVVPLGERAAKVRKRAGLGRAAAAWASVRRCAAVVAEQAAGFDLIYANTQKALVVGARAARIARKPLVFHQHDLITAEHFSRLNRWVAVRTINRDVSLVVANSQASATATRAAGGRPRRMAVVYNGFHLPKVGGSESPEQTAARRQETRAEFGLRANDFLVGVFGRLAEWKGQHVLLKALRDPRLNGRTHGLVVGAAMFGAEDEAYDRRLRRLAADSGESRVHFTGQRSDVTSLMEACDVVVHTSVTPEPFGRVVVEGMLAGRPVVATDAGGVREILRNEESGLLIPPGDARSLADALDRLLIRNRSAAGRLAEEGRRDAISRFSVRTMVDGVVSELKQLRIEERRPNK